MLTDLINNGIPGWVLLALAGLISLYMAAAVWTQISVGRLLRQNLFRSNRVNLPHLGKPLPVLPSGTESDESTALVLSRSSIPLNPDQPVARDFTNLIYPVAGRNGLHFAPDRCTGCGLCVYSCPTGAVRTEPADEKSYWRRFDLKACVFCGLCESACPTAAIRLTHNTEPALAQAQGLVLSIQVEAAPCRLCGKLVPSPDLLAERVYELPTGDGEPDEKDHARLVQAINPEGVCLECQKRVMEAEEIICG